MKNFLIVSDIHSNINVLEKLKDTKYWTDDNCHFIFNGDYIDGFNQENQGGLKVIRFVKDLVDSGKATALLGNHDQFWTETAKFNDMYYQTWLINGGLNTWLEMNITEMDRINVGTALNSFYKEETNFLNSLGSMFKTENILVVHAGIDWTVPLDKQTVDDLLWIRDDYIFAPNKALIDNSNLKRVIVSGHTPTSLIVPGNNCDIVEMDYPIKHYFIDGGSKGNPSGFKTHLNVIVLNEDGTKLDDFKLFE